ncbi:MAG: universal stress protein [Cytophagales bacterium]|nr:universal stress protein [Cytophagales bacterium]
MSSTLQQIKNILVPTDFSPASWEATRYALDLCHQHQAKMTLLHIVPGKNGSQAMQVAHMSKKLDELTQSLNTSDLNNLISGLTKSGMVVQEILNHLKEVPYDIVVMGVNGNGGMNMNLGKNAREIVENSQIPVRLVPNKKSNGS